MIFVGSFQLNNSILFYYVWIPLKFNLSIKFAALVLKIRYGTAKEY